MLVVVIALGAAGWTYISTDPSQQSTSSVLLVPPTTSADPNPLLGLDNNLSQLAAVLATTLESDATHQSLAKKSDTAAYSVQSLANPSPNVAQLSARLEFTTTDANANVAMRTANALVTEASTQLGRLQSQTSIVSPNKVRVLRLSGASQPVAVGNGKSRAMGITAGGVLVVGAFLIIVFDSVWRRRKPRPELHRSTRPLPDSLAGARPLPDGIAGAEGTVTPTLAPSQRQTRP